MEGHYRGHIVVLDSTIIQSLSEQFDIEVVEVSKILFRHPLRVL